MTTDRDNSATVQTAVVDESTPPDVTTTVGSPADWFHLYFPSRPFTDQLDILLAGDAYHRARALTHANPESRFVVLHDDPRTLQALEQLKAREAIKNLEIIEGSPTKPNLLHAAFDLIFFDAVLPHADGLGRCLKALRDALRPEGALHLKVPGKYGWHGINLLRRLASTLGIPPGDPGRDAAQELVRAIAEANRGPADLREAVAVAADRGLLDRVTQPEEAAFTIKKVLAELDRNGYRFQRFLYQAHYLPDASPLAADAQLLADAMALPAPQQWSLMELFRGSMAAHELITCRAGRPTPSYVVDLDGTNWLDYIPILSPLLTSSEDALPPGAALRLRCRGHLYPEISVLLNPTQTVLCHAMDRRRSARELVTLVDPEAADEAVAYIRNLLKSLWKYDYLWFQTPAA